MTEQQDECVGQIGKEQVTFRVYRDEGDYRYSLMIALYGREFEYGACGVFKTREGAISAAIESAKTAAWVLDITEGTGGHLGVTPDPDLTVYTAGGI